MPEKKIFLSNLNKEATISILHLVCNKGYKDAFYIPHPSLGHWEAKTNVSFLHCVYLRGRD